MAWWNSWFSGHKDEEKTNRVDHPNRRYDINVLNDIVDSNSQLNIRNRSLIDAGLVFDSSTIDLGLVNSSANNYGFLANKVAKNEQNWKLSLAPEVKWCIDELCSEFSGVKLNLVQESGYNELEEIDKSLIDQEFLRFSTLLNFSELNLIDDVKHLIIDGELAYELVKSQEHPEYGIIGIRRLYSDDFEVVYSPIITNGFALNIDLDKIFTRYGMSNTFSSGSKFLYNKDTGEYETDQHHAALSFPDVAYVYYDKLPNSSQALGLLDYAHKAFFELDTMQQASIVMRTVRSPERLLFNIDVGNLSDKMAQQHIQRFSQTLRARKNPMPGGMDQNGNPRVSIGQSYNPATMLETYIFGKSNQNQGTTVQTFGTQMNFDQISDIQYFHNRLLQVFKIPFARITDPSNKQFQPSQNLTYDEVRFYRFIEGIQERFNNALTKAFLEDLRLRGIGGGKVTESQVKLKFDEPERYALFLNVEKEKAKLDIYDSYSQHDEFNKWLLAKKYLGFLDSDIEAHKEANKKDKQEEEEEQDSGSDDSGEDSDLDFDMGGGSSGGGSDLGGGGEEDLGGEDLGGGEELGGEEESPSEEVPEEPTEG